MYRTGLLYNISCTEQEVYYIISHGTGLLYNISWTGQLGTGLTI